MYHKVIFGDYEYIIYMYFYKKLTQNVLPNFFLKRQKIHVY